MFKAEKKRLMFVAIIFTFLCVQTAFVSQRMNIWRELSPHCESIVSEGADDAFSASACIADNHSGFSADSFSTDILICFISDGILRRASQFREFFSCVSAGNAVLTRYLRSVIAIQTLK
jgi:hypothetical protein